MPEIGHRLGIAVPQHRVCEEFATERGLVEIWTPLGGDPELGGISNFVVGGRVAERSERTIVRVDLVADMRVEITAVAYPVR